MRKLEKISVLRQSRSETIGRPLSFRDNFIYVLGHKYARVFEHLQFLLSAACVYQKYNDSEELYGFYEKVSTKEI